MMGFVWPPRVSSQAMHTERAEAWARCTTDAKELTAFVRQVRDQCCFFSI